MKDDGLCAKVILRGEIDHCTCVYIRKEIEEAMYNRKLKTLVLDFSDVSFMDSSGVGMLIGRYKAMQERGGAIHAVGLNQQTKKLFTMAGLHRIISIGKNNVKEMENG